MHIWICLLSITLQPRQEPRIVRDTFGTRFDDASLAAARVVESGRFAGR